jgi:hypothetical protein
MPVHYEYLHPAIFGGGASPALRPPVRGSLAQVERMLLIDFSASGYLAARLENLETYVNREWFGEDRYDPRRPKVRASRPAPGDGCGGARRRLRASGLDTVPDTFVLTACWATICRRDTRRADAVQPALHAGP